MDWHGALDDTLPEVLRRAELEHGADPFVVDESGEMLSFSQLTEKAAGIAGGLLTRGIAPGDRIAIWAPNCSGWIIAACAIQMIGAILVPINTRFKGAEASSVLRKSGAKALFTVDVFLGNDFVSMLLGPNKDGLVDDLPDLSFISFLEQSALRPGVIAWNELNLGEAGIGAAWEAAAGITPSTICDMLFTSGTTGQPKGAMHAHGQSLWMAAIWNQANDLRHGDRALIVNPFFHSFGYRAGWVSALVAGMTVYPMAVFEVDAALRRIEKERITVLMGSPTLFSAILDHPDRASFDLTSLRVGHTGSANVAVELIERARGELGFDLFLTSYGLTEATALVSVCTPADSAETIAGTVGHGLPGTELRIIDGEGLPLPAGESGELLVRGPHVMQGYFEDSEATGQAIDGDGWLHTGDVGSIGEDGTLRIHDRLKDIVIVGGFNAYPAEIEQALAAHPAIVEIAVIAIPDARMGEVCGACVVLHPETSLTIAELTAWTHERLANFKLPRHLFLFDEFPRTSLGKVQKFALKAEALSRLSAAAA